jgi:transcriptional regulator GlxA family with amidase domain
MKHVSILVPECAVLAAIDDPRHVFSMVNSFYETAGKPPAFNIKLVGSKKEVKLHDSSFSVHTDSFLDDVEKTDLIFIPAFSGDMETALETNKEMIPWIAGQYERGAEVVSLCVGAFMLARTGLLNGKKCSTHWRAADQFRKMFPEVDLVTDKIITEEQGIYTSGGATSYWYLLIYLVEKFTNRETAIMISKIFAIDFKRDSQSQFIMFKGQNDHTDEDVKRAQKFIENNFQEKFTVDKLSAE